MYKALYNNNEKAVDIFFNILVWCSKKVQTSRRGGLTRDYRSILALVNGNVLGVTNCLLSRSDISTFLCRRGKFCSVLNVDKSLFQ